MFSYSVDEELGKGNVEDTILIEFWVTFAPSKESQFLSQVTVSI